LLPQRRKEKHEHPELGFLCAFGESLFFAPLRENLK